MAIVKLLLLKTQQKNQVKQHLLGTYYAPNYTLCTKQIKQKERWLQSLKSSPSNEGRPYVKGNKWELKKRKEGD